MILRFIKYSFIFIMLSTFLCTTNFIDVSARTLNIVLDPGHGGIQSGAVMGSEEGTVEEKDVNLKIAKYLKEELESYENVSIFLTRTDDQEVDLDDRTVKALNFGADVLVSLHNNAKGDCAEYTNGCTVLVSKGQYKEKLAEKEQELGCNILYELSELGLESQGLLLRTSESGEVYSNGQIADYYRLVRAGINQDLPSIIIEHAFIDHPDDYDSFLSSDEKLKALAKADARGIARYYQLQEKETNTILPQLKNVKERMVWIKDGDASHNEIYYKDFYKTDDQNHKNTLTILQNIVLYGDILNQSKDLEYEYWHIPMVNESSN